MLTIIALIRFDYGNDYMNYLKSYNQIISSDFTLNFEKLKDIYREPGWALINLLFKPLGTLGFFVMVALLAIFQNYVYYHFIKRYVSLQHRWLAVFVYLFNTSLYVLNMSMLRQGLTITVFILCISLILDRKWLKTLLILLAFSTVHSSISILVPFAFWGYMTNVLKKSWVIPSLYALLFLVFVFNKGFLEQTLMLVLDAGDMQEYAETYINEYEDNSFRLGLAFMINSIPFVGSLFYLLKSDDNSSNKILVSLACLGYIVSPFGQVSQMIMRVAFYFQAVSIATIPLVYYWLSPRVRLCLIGIYVAIMFYSYWMFFHSPTWIEHYYKFTTIFSM